MFGLIDGKVYAFLSLITTAILYAIDSFDKQEVVRTFLVQQAYYAQGSGLGHAAANLIVQPLIFAVDNPFGAILGGLLWPLLVVWLLLLLLLLGFAIIAPGVFRAKCTISTAC